MNYNDCQHQQLGKDFTYNIFISVHPTKEDSVQITSAKKNRVMGQYTEHTNEICLVTTIRYVYIDQLYFTQKKNFTTFCAIISSYWRG